MDWKTISNNVLLVGLFVGMVILFNQVNNRLDSMQTESNRRFDTMQTENQRQHDEIKDVLRVFEGRITRLEEKAGIGPETAE